MDKDGSSGLNIFEWFLLSFLICALVAMILIVFGIFDNTNPRYTTLDYQKLNLVNQSYAENGCPAKNISFWNLDCKSWQKYIQTFQQREGIASQLLKEDKVLTNILSQSVTKNIDCSTNGVRAECQAINIKLTEDKEGLSIYGGLTIDEIQQYYINVTNKQQALDLINIESKTLSNVE